MFINYGHNSPNPFVREMYHTHEIIKLYMDYKFDYKKTNKILNKKT